MKDLKIAAAVDQEISWAANLMASSEPWIKLSRTHEQCLKACRDREHKLFIAHNSSGPSGFILLHPQGLAGSPYVKSVCVLDTLRGQGIGTALILFAEDLFRKDAKHIFLCVSSFNEVAKVWYVRTGYVQVGEFKDYVIEGESEILLCKKLK